MKALLLKCSLGLLLLSIALTACKKSENIKRSGIINYNVLFHQVGGPGVVYNIKFDSDTILYRISNDLTPFGITISNTTFPVKVAVSSTPDAASFRVVTITALKVSN